MNDKISIRDIHVSFSTSDFFSGINANFPLGKLSIILGPNGSGKTTILKILAGVLKPKKGKVEYLSKETKIFYLPQKIRYNGNLTLFDYVSSVFFKDNFLWSLQKEQKEKICETLKLLEIDDKSEVLIENLSSGELQKANIALALLTDSQILLLDEPTSNMDLINRIKVLDILKKLTKRGYTGIIIMHDINISADYGDYFVGINKKRQIISGDKENFFTAKNLEEIYGIKFKINKNDKDFHIQIYN